MSAYLSKILDLVGADRRKLPWLVVLFIASSLLDFVGVGLVGPYVALIVDPGAMEGIAGRVLEALALPREQPAALIALGLVIGAVFLAKAIVAIAVHGAIIRFSSRQQARLQSELMGAFQRLRYTDFLRRNSAEYVYTIESLTAEFANVLQLLLRTVSDAIIALVLLALLAWQDAAALALLAVLLVSFVYGFDRLFRRKLRAYGEKATQSGTALVQAVQEGMEGVKEIRILGKEDYFHGRVARGAGDYARYSARANLIAAVPRYLLELTMVAFVISLAFLILVVGQDLKVLIPTLGMFGVASLRLIPAFNLFSTTLIRLRFSRNAVEQLHRNHAEASRAPAQAPQSGAVAPAEPFASLVLDRVTFAYAGAGGTALTELSIAIRANESVGLIGASGSGKTTLVDVLLGLLEPQGGNLLYNGRPLREELARWRSQVAYLPQQVFLIDNTLRRNIALGVEDDEIDEARLQEALRQARLAELVAHLPEGTGTNIGERGVRLSGGERQRVALARAFYHGRDVLIMDEATSALDNETEQEIVEEIRRLKGRKTLIVIAHRLSTVRHCDRICRLADGRIAEEGSYAELFGVPQAPAP